VAGDEAKPQREGAAARGATAGPGGARLSDELPTTLNVARGGSIDWLGGTRNMIGDRYVS
jgi:hypothetical protein